LDYLTIINGIIANPEYGKVISERFVSDTIKVIPLNGWQELP